MSQPYENLLPELLLGLLGHTGGAFIHPPGAVAGHATAPVLSSTIDWIDAPQREQLESLIKLGHYYSQLASFVEVACAGIDGTQRDSIYLVALANGISEVLDSYRSAVMRIEQNLMAAPAPPLLALQQWLAEFDQLLPLLARLIRDVQYNKLKGSDIMRLLDAKTQSGDPALQASAARLLWHCHRVMFKQLDAWLVHGLLLDPGNEFFIHQKSLKAAPPPASSPNQYAATSSKLEAKETEHAGLAEWHQGFMVSLKDLPPRVDLPTADLIMFVGKAVRILRQPGSFVDSEYMLQVHTKLLSFSPVLQQLQRRPVMYASALKHAIEGMTATVAGLLWELIQQRCNLEGQLAAMQAYFLLGCGDLYQQFLQEAGSMFISPPRAATAEADLALLFKQAATQSSADSDPHFTAVNLRWLDVAAVAVGDNVPSWHPSLSPNTWVPAYDAWDGMFLEWEVLWPLHLFLPPEVLRKYGALWQYMLRMKRVQADLDAAWAVVQSSVRGSNGHKKDALMKLRTRLSHLRQQMAHFVNNLELYVQLDVVTPGSAQLRKRIAAAKDFTEADEIHRSFVDSMISQTFLDVKQVVDMIQGIFMETKKLFVLAQDLDQGMAAAAAETRLLEIEQGFNTKHSLFFQLVQSSKLQSNSRAPALRQLILRLNFNSYCEQKTLQDIQSRTY